VASELDDLIHFLDQSSVKTSHGSFVSIDNVKKWVAEKQAQSLEDAGKPRPRTMVQAKRMAERDEEIFPPKPFRPADPGASIPAGPQPGTSP
jgi:hypothetical protein